VNSPRAIRQWVFIGRQYNSFQFPESSIAVTVEYITFHLTLHVCLGVLAPRDCALGTLSCVTTQDICVPLEEGR
jgi:hypothetical protein